MKDRLIEERKRLGLNQDEMAKTGKVAKRTYCDYEAGVSEPKAGFLASIAAAGADVLYIVTGMRMAQPMTDLPLNPREAALLDNYRNTEDESGKKIIEAAASAAAQPQEKVTKRKTA